MTATSSPPLRAGAALVPSSLSTPPGSRDLLRALPSGNSEGQPAPNSSARLCDTQTHAAASAPGLLVPTPYVALPAGMQGGDFQGRSQSHGSVCLVPGSSRPMERSQLSCHVRGSPGRGPSGPPSPRGTLSQAAGSRQMPDHNTKEMAVVLLSRQVWGDGHRKTRRTHISVPPELVLQGCRSGLEGAEPRGPLGSRAAPRPLTAKPTLHSGARTVRKRPHT